MRSQHALRLGMSSMGMPSIGELPRPAVVSNTGAGAGDVWTFEEDKAFEMALVANWMQPDRVAKCRAAVPRKSLDAMHHRYALLEADVSNIARGAVRLPVYNASVMPSPPPVPKGKKGAGEERRKGVPWTEEEHRLFVAGLAEFGKGDWRSISRNYVLTRTPTQVASHAQKYFIRMNSGKKSDKRRSSIHDITSSTGGALGGGGGGGRIGAAGGASKASQGGRGPLQGGAARASAPRHITPTSRPPLAAAPARPLQQGPLQGGQPPLQGGQPRPVGAPRSAGLHPNPRPQHLRPQGARPFTLERPLPAGTRPVVPALPSGAARPPGGASQPIAVSTAASGRVVPLATMPAGNARPPPPQGAAAAVSTPTSAPAVVSGPAPAAQDKKSTL